MFRLVCCVRCDSVLRSTDVITDLSGAPTHGCWVQVTNDEAGLRGCWFPAVVQQTERGLVLVAYDEVDDEDTGNALQEWFPAPGAHPTVATLASNFKIHTAPGYLVRPQPPEDVSVPCVYNCI